MKPKLSLDQFIAKYSNRVSISCAYETRRYQGLLSHIDLNEFIQDVWVTILRNYPRYDPAKSAPATWIITIARCQGAMYARREKVRAKAPMIKLEDMNIRHLCRENRGSDYTQSDYLEAALSVDATQQTDCEREEREEMVERALGRLDKKYRVALWYTFHEGLNTRDMRARLAADTGCEVPLGFCIRLKNKAIEKFKRAVFLEQQGEVEDDSPVEVLDLKTSTMNQLYAVGIRSVGALLAVGPSRLSCMEGFKLNRVLAIRLALKKHGLEFVDGPTD